MRLPQDATIIILNLLNISTKVPVDSAHAPLFQNLNFFQVVDGSTILFQHNHNNIDIDDYH